MVSCSWQMLITLNSTPHTTNSKETKDCVLTYRIEDFRHRFVFISEACISSRRKIPSSDSSVFGATGILYADGEDLSECCRWAFRKVIRSSRRCGRRTSPANNDANILRLSKKKIHVENEKALC